MVDFRSTQPNFQSSTPHFRPGAYGAFDPAALTAIVDATTSVATTSMAVADKVNAAKQAKAKAKKHHRPAPPPAFLAPPPPPPPGPPPWVVGLGVLSTLVVLGVLLRRPPPSQPTRA